MPGCGVVHGIVSCLVVLSPVPVLRVVGTIFVGVEAHLYACLDCLGVSQVLEDLLGGLCQPAVLDLFPHEDCYWVPLVQGSGNVGLYVLRADVTDAWLLWKRVLLVARFLHQQRGGIGLQSLVL